MPEINMDDSKIKVKSLYKSIQLLAFFDQAHVERGITELAELSGMLKSSVHNIVSTFEVCRILKRNPKTGKYQLGTRVLEYANVYSASNPIDVTLKPYMDSAAELIGETIHLAIRDRTKVLYVRSSVPRSQLNGFQHICGVTADMYCTGVGKAMLAFMPAEVIEEVVAGEMPRYTDNTITTRQELLKELGEIREHGYAIDNMEHEYGIKCVGVPIFSTNNELLGAISATGPSPRFTHDKIEEYSKLLMGIAHTAKSQLF